MRHTSRVKKYVAHEMNASRIHVTHMNATYCVFEKVIEKVIYSQCPLYVKK